MIVRRVRPEESDLLRDLSLRAVRTDPDSFVSTSTSEAASPAERWTTWAAASASGNDQAAFFAELEGEVVGMVGAFRQPNSPREITVISMWVAPAVRRRGVGRSLIATVIRWASGADADALNLWVVDGNSSAIDAYRAAGFETVGDKRAVKGHPTKMDWHMRLVLGSGRKAPFGYVEFAPMEQREFDAYLAAAIPRAAAVLIEHIGLGLSEASERALRVFSERLPNGEATKGHHLCTLRVGADDHPVGWTWFASTVHADRPATRLHDLLVFEPYRRQGFASAAVDELEEWSVSQGHDFVVGDVVSDNEAALSLAVAHGYETTSTVDIRLLRVSKDVTMRHHPPNSRLA